MNAQKADVLGHAKCEENKAPARLQSIYLCVDPPSDDTEFTRERSENGHQSAIQAFALIALLEHFLPMGVAAVQVHV
jgi:hypothetical protein